MAKRGASGLSLMLAIEKPKGLTSHDVVNRCRRVLSEKRIGHTGTLDPLASGVLCVAVGPATRLDAYMAEHTKTYVMDIAFGCATSTDDAEGDVVSCGNVPDCLWDEDYAANVVAGLKGAGMQLPPVYSAVKVGGQKSYAAARKGNVIELKPRAFEVFASSLDALGEANLGSLLEQGQAEGQGKAEGQRFDDGQGVAEGQEHSEGQEVAEGKGVAEGQEHSEGQEVAEGKGIGENYDKVVPVWRVTMCVSGGTYMRSIARDLGKQFGCGAFVSRLERTAVDNLTLRECVTLEQFEADPRSAQIDPLRLLNMRYAFVRDAAQISAIDNGGAIPARPNSATSSPDTLDETPGATTSAASSPDTPGGTPGATTSAASAASTAPSTCVLELNCALPSLTQACDCTTQVFPSPEPCYDGEEVALLVDNRLKAIYKFDEGAQRFVAQCVFPVGVERGSYL